MILKQEWKKCLRKRNNKVNADNKINESADSIHLEYRVF